MNPLCLNDTTSKATRISFPHALIWFADSEDQFDEWPSREHMVDELRLVVSDIPADSCGRRAPKREDAERIWAFAEKHRPLFLAIRGMTIFGLPRSTQAAILRAYDVADLGYRCAGNYNRALYYHILDVAGVKVPPPPLVSVALHHAAHPPEYMLEFMLSMERQYHKCWEVVCVIDKTEPLYDPAWQYITTRWGPERLRLIPVENASEKWGHPHRQRAIDECRGEFIGISNSDNYYVPGFMDTMLMAMEGAETELAACGSAQAYTNWGFMHPAQDMGAFLASRRLISKVRWEGDNFASDGDYFGKLANLAGQVAAVGNGLFVHN